ncbi:hypothetical protein XBKB1_4280001 [Xenorhabdus bovienii str. kraussei Becker Underwood]|uniref:Uncharacterized protein n=1 Tax=Xenorhabdus bovienii str. kraussei Becker Underwood TaxID=1398204 RepID=A0A077PND8_XENBV|nr:hypothetical protein XBKB1_4280001 [Xenorhabdus bovienii str. kraussei Becker Underwood]
MVIFSLREYHWFRPKSGCRDSWLEPQWGRLAKGKLKYAKQKVSG